MCACPIKQGFATRFESTRIRNEKLRAENTRSIYQIPAFLLKYCRIALPKSALKKVLKHDFFSSVKKILTFFSVSERHHWAVVG